MEEERGGTGVVVVVAMGFRRQMEEEERWDKGQERKKDATQGIDLYRGMRVLGFFTVSLQRR